ncbi:MAG TPA: peptidoglycan bridge formation glycyltransferase FemA/FemB family protein [Candidatus Nanoarchaeia archaeon]|nr:peptidoglycan bridge formation glycyltransferase FemA/FemB family protein [Candidatus Nanoarchaeia archaeon]
MNLVEIKDKKRLDEFLGARPHAEFLQSWEWGEFQEKVEGPVMSGAEGKIFRLGVEENGELIAAATLIKKSLPFDTNYFYCPRGPIVNYKLQIINYKLIDFLFEEIRKIAEKEKVIFLRIEPKEKIQNSKFKIQNSLDIQPSQTVVLDLNRSEDELLAAMHQKTRYNIRLAEKKDVKIQEAARGGFLAGDGEKEFEKFWNLMQKTSGRDGFTPHDRDYYEKLLHVAPEKFKLFFALFEDKIIAAGIFSFFGDTATYLFGASDNKSREVMASYLLQWEMIKRAKAASYKYYDFFGIDEKKWPGVTRFKRGFGGQEIDYPGTFDVIFNSSKYFIYKALRFVRRFF